MERSLGVSSLPTTDLGTTARVSQYSPGEESPLLPVSFLLLYLCPQPLAVMSAQRGESGLGAGTRGALVSVWPSAASPASNPDLSLPHHRPPAAASPLFREPRKWVRAPRRPRCGLSRCGLSLCHPQGWVCLTAAWLPPFRHLCLMSSSPESELRREAFQQRWPQ